MRASAEWMERHQVVLYVAGLALGAIVGLAWPAVAHPAELAIHPVLALLLYATFLGIPFDRIGRAFRDWRFLSTILVVNFVLVPMIVWPLSRIVAHDQALLVGVLFVLLTPCIDYVIVFAGLAGGDEERLLAAAPLLMIAQMLLLPVYMWLFVGAEFASSIEVAPFVEAFVLIIALPLLAAALTQLAAARWQAGRGLELFVTGAMVPLMITTLAVVVASQISGVSARLGSLLLAVPVYVLFAAVMVPVGMLASRVAGLDVPGRRAVIFSGVTRNSLVVLPLVLALPATFEIAPLVVVTQTLVELVAMIIFIRLIPRVLSVRPGAGSERTSPRHTREIET
ncbi:arsenic resistance protein [Brachybacterium fresconis]|uniref:ACR3 family arsenite efflux pump ArsB n=1 Tax=Brachybacterium fresconis TaxID=173363 RepID=A0ABS4YIP1_9MICO|nr:bile acid:sodium symporter [Brachybacterium fresconis]MBP2408676.1 ACR3 family arsenite efflux pump ArsB [Brachybacterium fresconis]